MSLVFITMYVLKVSSIIAEDTVNFIALIVNRNNPNIDRIIDDFDEFIGFFNHNSSLKFEIMAKQLYVASQRVL